MLRAGAPARWIPTTKVRSNNELTGFKYAKIYDAVVELRANGDTKTFALEYERSRKAKTNYAEIAEDMAAEERVSIILYLAANYDLLKFLSGEFRGHTRRVVFGLVREWHSRLLEMPVETPECSGWLPFLDLLA